MTLMRNELDGPAGRPPRHRGRYAARAWPGADRGRAVALAGTLLFALATPASGQILSNPDYSGSIVERSTLTGDWGGERGALARRGLHIDLDSVLTYQGVASGGREDDDDFIGSTALQIQLDSGKMGLWPGGLVKFRAEARYGDGIQPATGALSPVNTDSLAPIDPDHLGDEVLAVTELMVLQFLSEKIGVFAGLLNTEEGDHNALAGSLRDESRFMNTALRLSLTEGQLAPNVTLGAGVIWLPVPGVTGSVSVLDTEESAGQNPFDTSEGTTFATEWSLDYGAKTLPGRQTVGFLAAFGQDFTQIGALDRADVRRLIRGEGLPTHDSSVAVYWNGHQTVHRQGSRSIGVFGRLSFADGDVNPVHWTAALGVGGEGLLPSRAKDVWGAGFYHLEFSEGPLFRLLDIESESGLEVFYNAAVTPWFNVTANVQVIEPALGRPRAGVLPTVGPGGLLPLGRGLVRRRDGDTAVILGLRARVQF